MRMYWKLGAVGMMTALVLVTGCKKSAPEPAAPVPVATTKPVRVPVTMPPKVKKNLYPPIAEANADIAKGIAEARKEHKRVILDFGGDWCGDCQVLDIYFNQEPNADLLKNNFVKVNVNIGHE